MSFTPLTALRRRPARRLFSLLATLALLFAGFAQATHIHKGHVGHPARAADTHLQCLLCLHADRSAGPPQLPQIAGPVLTARTLIGTSEAPHPARFAPRCYDARGPPLV